MKKWLMAVALANATLMTDGDAAFLRVDNRRPPHALEPGVLASATNCRFEKGRPWPRFGVGCDAWGSPYGIQGAWSVWDNYEGSMQFSVAPRWANGTKINVRAIEGNDALPPELHELTDYYVRDDYEGTVFSVYPSAADAIAGTNQIVLSGTGGAAQTYQAKALKCKTLAYARFSDPVTETDNTILLTDDWRDAAGEDGGRGRAWRIAPGNAPLEIPLNGHDVWDTCRLVQCENAVVLLRAHAKQRYYFSATAVENGPDRIQLNVTPPWAVDTGRRVLFKLAIAGSAIYGTLPPADGGYYYAKHITADKVELYQDAGLASILSWEITTNPPVGAFYIEEAEDPLPFWENAAQNLIMQPGTAGQPAVEMGFDWVLENVAVTSTDKDADTITAPNHRLLPGHQVDLSLSTTGSLTGKYAAPQTKDTLRLYDSSDAALADDGTTDLYNVANDGETGAIWKSSAAGAPLPPCREGAYLNGRFIGIARRDTVIVSDPLDFLHCTLMASSVAANVGDAGRANWILPLGDDVAVIGKDLNVIAISGLSGASTSWKERIITAEYNGLAPLAAVQVGSDVRFASRKGWASVVRTVAGETLGVPGALSDSIPEDLRDVDWSQARGMCAATWDNRLFWAVPGKGQTEPVNNRVLVFNERTRRLRLTQTEVAGDIVGTLVEAESGSAIEREAWEGVWTGDLLTPYAFARLTVNGEERLTFATPDGLVCWLHDGWDDNGAEIESEIVTRGYFGGRQVLALRGKFNWDTFNPSITAEILTAGVGEEETLTGFDALTYDRTKYTTDGTADYDPSTSTEAQFDAPHREDYSPTPEEVTVARLDVHQNTSEPFFCRVRGSAPQLRLTNTQGSLRLCSVSLQAKPVGVRATKET